MSAAPGPRCSTGWSPGSRGGTFILRIEDTDAERNREEWVDGILSAMHWLGHGPRRGSLPSVGSATDRYRQAVDALWDGGHLYACDCTREEIDARNKAAGIQTPGYDGFCRHRGLSRGDGRALRFRTPDDGVTVVDDVIRGHVEFPCATMDDFVAREGQRGAAVRPGQRGGRHRHGHHPRDPGRGPPADDAEGGAGVGGPLDAVGRPTARRDEVVHPGLPVFAHLPLLVNEQRKKLSKRRDKVAVEEYRDQGYLPDAFVNYLGLLGWSPPGGQELFDTDQMVEWFRLEDVNHSPAFFDVASSPT